MATATLVGGLSVTTPLTGNELTALQNALAILSVGQTQGQVLTSPNSAATPPGTLFIYNFPADGKFTLPSGAGGVVLSQDNQGIHQRLIGRPGTTFVIAGNNRNEFLNGGGGNGTIIGGNGNNQVFANNGNNVDIFLGTGNDTVTLGGGFDTVNADGNLTLKGAAGNPAVVNLLGSSRNISLAASGHITTNLTGNRDTVRVSTGRQTINVTGRGNQITSVVKHGVVINESGPVSMVFNGIGNDTVTMGDGSNTINDSGPITLLGGGPSGNGHNRVTLTGRSASIDADGNNNITLGKSQGQGNGPTFNATVGGGNDTITATTKLNLTEIPGAGNLNVTGIGHDTFNLSTGNATVTDPGGATIFGGGGDLKFIGGSGGRDQVVVGSGNASLIGDGGKNVFHAGSGNATMRGGAGSQDTFTGAQGHDTMSAPGAKSAIFSFNSTLSGGTHLINHFEAGPDKLQLLGYDTTTVLNNATVVNGSTLLDLGDGTTIKLLGFTGLTASDFKS
jgi:hypothetical protein